MCSTRIFLNFQFSLLVISSKFEELYSKECHSWTKPYGRLPYMHAGLANTTSESFILCISSFVFLWKQSLKLGLGCSSFGRWSQEARGKDRKTDKERGKDNKACVTELVSPPGTQVECIAEFCLQSTGVWGIDLQTPIRINWGVPPEALTPPKLPNYPEFRLCKLLWFRKKQRGWE